MIVMATGLEKNPPAKVELVKRINCSNNFKYNIRLRYFFSQKDSIINITSTAFPSPVTAITSGVAAGGALSLSGLSLVLWIMKRLRQKANKFELNRLDKHPSLLFCTVFCLDFLFFFSVDCKAHVLLLSFPTAILT